MQTAVFREYIARQRPGWSLEGPFYTSSEIYEMERRGLLAEKWYVLGHCSEFQTAGSYIVRSVLGESLLVVRGVDGAVRGFYNVCRHRGSRICEQDGQAKSFVCPYHAWSYRLDGSLRSAPAMSENIELKQLGLHPISVREIGGLVLGSLAADPSSLDGVAQQAEPMLRYHGIRGARIAARRNYRTFANWKLVMENFFECYHCYPTHAEYCSAMPHVKVVAREPTPEVAAAWQEEVARWFREEADPASPVDRAELNFSGKAMEVVSRTVIGSGRKTQSADGAPVAPLMGQQSRFDGGVALFRLRPFCFLTMLNDYALMFQFLPRGPEETDVVLNWLVDGSATESQVDVERMVWMWDVTTLQDKIIVERNAEGVRSLSYVPGPYSATLEQGPAHFVSGYLKELATSCAGGGPKHS
jgi:phenylpropionate dioxygenase-like ring-hydroxylating dioxygenase large terminal subunit